MTFKIAVLTFKALHDDLSPVYMQQLVRVYTPARRLRSADSNALVVLRTRSRASDCTGSRSGSNVERSAV